MSLCPRDAPRNQVAWPSTSAFPCEVCWLLFQGHGGHHLHHAARAAEPFSWRAFAVSAPLQDSVWLLCRLRHPDRTLAFSRPWAHAPQVKRCRTSQIPFVQTTEPVAACSTPG